jgi:hypothetical protein
MRPGHRDQLRTADRDEFFWEPLAKGDLPNHALTISPMQADDHRPLFETQDDGCALALIITIKEDRHDHRQDEVRIRDAIGNLPEVDLVHFVKLWESGIKFDGGDLLITLPTENRGNGWDVALVITMKVDRDDHCQDAAKIQEAIVRMPEADHVRVVKLCEKGIEVRVKTSKWGHDTFKLLCR